MSTPSFRDPDRPSSGVTIFAPASGSGRAAVAVIRIAGPRAAAILRAMTGRLPTPRVASLAGIRAPDTGAVLDHGLVLWFPAPHSFTGEDVAELQLHGSRAVVAAVLEVLGRQPGCRLAEPGEFSRRAFLNGMMDLAAVEGLADLIDAQTEAQRKQALHQLEGTLGRWVDGLREGLLDALALAESAIDFADEGDVAATALHEAGTRAAALAATIRSELGRPQNAERIREGFVITLAGPPNAGKSTLLNAFARREAAIVSPHAGTTRDPIAIELDLGGYAVVIVDTAGIRTSTDPVEQEGIKRARAKAASADLVLWLQDCALIADRPEAIGSAPCWMVGTKVDCTAAPAAGFDHLISAQTGAGMDALLQHLQTVVAADLTGGEMALVTRLRHRLALEEAAAALLRIGAVATDPELAAEEMRAAAQALGRITGRIDVEDVLGAIFSRFCIGK